MLRAPILVFTLMFTALTGFKMPTAHADTVITAKGKDSTWQNILSQDTLAVKIDGQLEYLWDFKQGYVLWRGKQHYWGMVLDKQEQTLEDFWWGALEIEQHIVLPNTPCNQTNRHPTMQQQCFGYALSNLPAKGESKIWEMLETTRFSAEDLQCNWSSKEIGALAMQVVDNRAFNDWIKKPRKTLFLHPLMLFMNSPSNTVKLDALREHGAHALTLYASRDQACAQATPPSITVETVTSAKTLYTAPNPDDVVEFNYQHFFKPE